MNFGNLPSGMEPGAAYQRVVSALDNAGLITRHGSNRVEGRCPAHEDRNASLSVAPGRGLALVYCHAGCRYDDVASALDLSPADLFDDRKGVTYRYGNGLTVHRKPNKNFPQSGTLTSPRELYRRDEVDRAVAAGQEVWLTEGEKDADTMAQGYGVTATTWSMGAMNVSKTDFSPLAGARINIVQDNDEAGAKATGELVSVLSAMGCDITVVRAKTGKDASDHYATGHTLAEFVDLPLPAPSEPERSLYSVRDLMTMTFPEQTWVVDGLISQGLTLLAGAPKIGKSWMALGIGVAVASGRPALGSRSVIRGSVLYLALEDTTRRLPGRLRMVGAELDDALDFQLRSNVIGQGCEEQVEQWLAMHPDAKLVIIDVLSKVRGTGGHGTAYADEYADMNALKAIADKYGIAVIAVHHTRKADAIDAVDTVSGTHALAGACDLVMVLSRARGRYEAKLTVTGRDVEEAELAATLAQGRWTIQEGKAPQAVLHESRQVILDCLRSIGDATPKEIAEHTDQMDKYEAIKKSCQRMHVDGQLHSLGDGKYRALEDEDQVVLRREGVPAVPLSPDLASDGDGDGEALAA